MAMIDAGIDDRIYLAERQTPPICPIPDAIVIAAGVGSCQVDPVHLLVFTPCPERRSHVTRAHQLLTNALDTVIYVSVESAI